VREFSPNREEEVIVMQQVTEIYGRENGWGHSPYYILKLESLHPSAPSGAAGLWWLALRSYASLA